ncbi:MAG: hypothetical protein K8R21_07355, partial [Leptospira sp.]|nr:hypothetical protein [Leptospira sp.]
NESLFTGLKRKRKITLKSISAVSSAEYSEIETDLIFSDNMRLQKAHFFGTKFGETIEFDGLIGNDLLSRFHLFIDFPDSILFIERRFDYGNLGDSGFDSINFLFENGNVFIPAWIGGKRFNRMVFDTGAGLSYLNASKIDSINLSEAGVTQYIDIFGVRKFDSLYKVSGICLFNPDYCEKNVKALLGDSLKNFQDGRENMDGIIGNALMNRTFVLIDYSKKKIYFKLKSKNVQ